MKLKNIKWIILIMFLGICAVMPQVYAKTSIEIKPNASAVYTNKTISDFFDESIAMKNVGEGLEGSNVDVHMATNTDWAIFAYFSNGQYGTSGEGKNTGVNVTVGGRTYMSTNGNITGMMNLGVTKTYTAGLISNYAEILDTSTAYANAKSLIKNATNSTYVNLINTLSAKSMAKTGWYNSRNEINTDTGYPISMRVGLFGFMGGKEHVGGGYNPSGQAQNYTFRPIIWN